jgi:hypothetical protein
MPALRELQAAFFGAITSPAGASTPRGLRTAITGDERLDADGRLAVYARMYAARLVDVLFEDYPRVAAVVGADDFANVARAYVAAHPSTHPSLRWFGSDFAASLAAWIGRDDTRPAFLADLARLEWARLAVFDAPDATPLAAAALHDVPPEAWATLRLRLVPALEVLRTGWPVHRIWDPEGTAPAGGWRPADTWLRVWRRSDDTVYQASLDETERLALERVRAGDDFATLCEALTAVAPADRAAETAAGLVLRWIEDGILSAASLAA